MSKRNIIDMQKMGEVTTEVMDTFKGCSPMEVIAICKEIIRVGESKLDGWVGEVYGASIDREEKMLGSLKKMLEDVKKLSKDLKNE